MAEKVTSTLTKEKIVLPEKREKHHRETAAASTKREASHRKTKPVVLELASNANTGTKCDSCGLEVGAERSDAIDSQMCPQCENNRAGVVIRYKASNPRIPAERRYVAMIPRYVGTSSPEEVDSSTGEEESDDTVPSYDGDQSPGSNPNTEATVADHAYGLDRQRLSEPQPCHSQPAPAHDDDTAGSKDFADVDARNVNTHVATSSEDALNGPDVDVEEAGFTIAKLLEILHFFPSPFDMTVGSTEDKADPSTAASHGPGLESGDDDIQDEPSQGQKSSTEGESRRDAAQERPAEAVALGEQGSSPELQPILVVRYKTAVIITVVLCVMMTFIIVALSYHYIFTYSEKATPASSGARPLKADDGNSSGGDITGRILVTLPPYETSTPEFFVLEVNEEK